MTDADEMKRLQLATRLHGATLPVIEMLMTTDGAPTLGELHVICKVAERIERTGYVHGVAGPLFTQLLATLMQTTADVRAYLDHEMQGVIAERAARADPAAVLEALDKIADAPPEPGDEMLDDVAAAVEREVTMPGVVSPEGLPDSVAERLQQLADAGGRIAIDVGDLTPEELELLADSEIPPELQWTLDDVDAARAEILEIIDRMPPHLIESARDAVRDVDIQSRIGTRSQFDEIEEQTRREEAEPLPDDIAAAVERAVADDGMPPHMIALFEQLADTPYDIAAVDAAAKVYAAAVKAAGGAYGHALAAVWRAWHREDGGQE